jgi:glyoxylase-like metal-dependent hydrolase (beta-lactamase superfamily II)
VKLELVMPGVWRIDLGMVNAYLCADSDRLTLIDAGLATSAGDIAAGIVEAGYRVDQLAQIVLTHFHDDHRGSASALRVPPAIRVLAHAADAQVIRGLAPQPTIDLSDGNERKLHDAIVPGVPPAPACDVDRELTDGDAIDMAGVANVVAVPGHTPGSIALLVHDHGLLFTGDAVANFGGRAMMGPFNVDRTAARASFAKIAALDFEVACVGHGDPVTKDASRAVRAAAGQLELVP